MLAKGLLMSASVTTASTTATNRAARRIDVPVLIAGAVVAVAANTIVSFAALAAGASSQFLPLTIALYAPFTVLGFFAAYVGWRVVRGRAKHPAAVLRVLVPVLAILSFVPDTMLAIFGFIPDSSITGVVGLVIMHLVVVGVAVPVFQRIAPTR
jgi:hypothetical protein